MGGIFSNDDQEKKSIKYDNQNELYQLLNGLSYSSDLTDGLNLTEGLSSVDVGTSEIIGINDDFNNKQTNKIPNKYILELSVLFPYNRLIKTNNVITDIKC